MNKRKRPTSTSWRLDEAYIKVAVDKNRNTVDFLLIKRSMKGSAQKFLN